MEKDDDRECGESESKRERGHLGRREEGENRGRQIDTER